MSSWDAGHFQDVNSNWLFAQIRFKDLKTSLVARDNQIVRALQYKAIAATASHRFSPAQARTLFRPVPENAESERGSSTGSAQTNVRRLV
jgi:hypothetical protein